MVDPQVIELRQGTSISRSGRTVYLRKQLGLQETWDLQDDRSVLTTLVTGNH